MSQTTTPRLPGWGEVLRAQLLLMLRCRRRGLAIFLGILLLQMVLLGAFGIVLGLTISTSPDDQTNVLFSRVNDFDEKLDRPLGQAVWALVIAFFVTHVFAFFWTFSVFDATRPAERDYRWSMPVSRAAHDLASLVAGGVVVVGVAAVLYATGILAAGLTGHAAGLAWLSPWSWLCLFLGPLLPYLFSSLFAVAFRHPAAWLWGSLGVGALAWGLATLTGFGPLEASLGRLAMGPAGLVQALVGAPGFDLFRWPTASGLPWLGAWALWAGLLTAAIVFAASRRRRAL